MQGLLGILYHFLHLRKIHFGAVLQPRASKIPILVTRSPTSKANPTVVNGSSQSSNEYSNEEAFVMIAGVYLSAVRILSVGRHIYKREKEGETLKLCPL
jgi:hypothetical protein